MNGPPINTATMSSTFDEAAELIKLMWTEETPSFEGRYYSIRESCCRPKPVQKPHMPLMVAGDGERLTLRTAAKHRDMSNFPLGGHTRDIQTQGRGA